MREFFLVSFFLLWPGMLQATPKITPTPQYMEALPRTLKLSPEDRAEVEKLMEPVRTALTDRKWDKVTATSNELADALFYLEDI